MKLVIEHHEDLEYDLLTVCGVDLLDFWRGTLSPRRLLMFIKRLPAATSRYVAASAPDVAEIAQWTATDYILADIYDVTVRGSGRFKNPQPYPRISERVQRRAVDNARRKALIEKYEARHGKGGGT